MEKLWESSQANKREEELLLQKRKRNCRLIFYYNEPDGLSSLGGHAALDYNLRVISPRPHVNL